MSDLTSSDYLPTASLVRLQQRAKLLARLREFFRSHDYWECETPVLSRDIVVDANLDPFVTCDADGSLLYLQTSPEGCMKRLLAAGATAIFQVSRVMRKGESGQRHNPEFTMIEWYRVGDTHLEQMEFVEQLVRTIYDEAMTLAPGLPCREDSDISRWPQPFERLTYDTAFERYVGTKVLALSTPDLRRLAVEHRIFVPESLSPDDRDGWLNLLLADLIEPHLGLMHPQFVYDYPASQAALARLSPEDKAVAERFELYDRGIELCNGYHELTDSAELARRTECERLHRQKSGTPDLPGAPRLEAAMRAGLPPCCGVALGFDRLVMLALGCSQIANVIAFPHDRA